MLLRSAGYKYMASSFAILDVRERYTFVETDGSDVHFTYLDEQPQYRLLKLLNHATEASRQTSKARPPYARIFRIPGSTTIQRFNSTRLREQPSVHLPLRSPLNFTFVVKSYTQLTLIVPHWPPYYPMIRSGDRGGGCVETHQVCRRRLLRH